MKRQERESNIELLRILATLGVFFLHFNTAINGSAFTESNGINSAILYILETVSVCGVDLLLLISGYFMVSSDKCNLWKPIELIIQSVILASAIPYIIEVALGKSTFEFSSLVWKLLNISYFIILYSVLYIVSPFINRLLNSLSKKDLKILIITLFLLFSCYPITVDWLSSISGKNLDSISSVGLYGDGDGYTIVNFIMMYCIGAFLRLNRIEEKIRCRYLSVGLLALLVVDFVWAYNNGSIGPDYVAWEYCNPLVVGIAITAFLLFKRRNLGKNKIINGLAKSSFTFFILHSKFIKLLDAGSIIHMNPAMMTLCIVGIDIGIYLIIWGIWYLWNIITKPLFSFVEGKIGFLTIEVDK